MMPGLGEPIFTYVRKKEEFLLSRNKCTEAPRLLPALGLAFNGLHSAVKPQEWGREHDTGLINILLFDDV